MPRGSSPWTHKKKAFLRRVYKNSTPFLIRQAFIWITDGNYCVHKKFMLGETHRKKCLRHLVSWKANIPNCITLTISGNYDILKNGWYPPILFREKIIERRIHAYESNAKIYYRDCTSCHWKLGVSYPLQRITKIRGYQPYTWRFHREPPLESAFFVYYHAFSNRKTHID